MNNEAMTLLLTIMILIDFISIIALCFLHIRIDKLYDLIDAYKRLYGEIYEEVGSQTLRIIKLNGGDGHDSD